MHKTTLFAILFGVLACIGTITIESLLRRINPTSIIRPTSMIKYITKICQYCFETVGYYVGFITDIYGFIKEYFPFEDIKNLIIWTFNFITTPFYAFEGYFDYYYSSYGKDIFNEYWYTSCIVIVLIVLSICLVIYKTRKQ